MMQNRIALSMSKIETTLDKVFQPEPQHWDQCSPTDNGRASLRSALQGVMW